MDWLILLSGFDCAIPVYSLELELTMNTSDNVTETKTTNYLTNKINEG
jgi:hypothetical protein